MVVTAWASRAFPSRTPALASVRPLTISATGPKASRALVVAARPSGAGARASANPGSDLLWLDNPPIALSSSQVRRLARTRHTLRYLVPESVRTYIERHRLYRGSR